MAIDLSLRRASIFFFSVIIGAIYGWPNDGVHNGNEFLCGVFLVLLGAMSVGKVFWLIPFGALVGMMFFYLPGMPASAVGGSMAIIFSPFFSLFFFCLRGSD